MIVNLRAAGTGLLLDARGTEVPAIVHWGRDLGELSPEELEAVADAAVPAIPPSSTDTPLRLSVLPTIAEGWSGRPGVAGHHPGEARRELRFSLAGVDEVSMLGVDVRLQDAAVGLSVVIRIELSPEGVLQLRHTLLNRSHHPFELASLDAILPVPGRASELLDFTGLWGQERRPQRHPLGHGAWSRETRHGRPGHDDPMLMVAGIPGFGFRHGEVWAVHLAWSGDKRLWAEGQSLGASVLGAGELLAPGEIRLEPAESYESPLTVATWSDAGLDGLSGRLHPWIRSWSIIRGVQPVVLNTWEAVYFDHEQGRLDELVDAAAEAGVERFVLDDGWFAGRNDATTALGDWFVDPIKWPQGLALLVERVRSAGMDFGLWFEPEMISADSHVAREHPEWVLGSHDALEWRDQRVIDLANPQAFDFVLSRLDALVSEYAINYIKWDMNRDLLIDGSHAHVAALYRLIDELRARHPLLDIESCASGGARIDLGVLRRVHRVWTSDSNDPLERQLIQRHTGVLVPPEYLGSHLGDSPAHTSGRASALAFRFATALFGSAGIEWDLSRADAGERAAVAGWLSFVKRMRPLLHSGTVVRGDAVDESRILHGVVSLDQKSALFADVSLAAARSALPERLRFPGLDPDRRYRVQELSAGGVPDAQLTLGVIEAAMPPSAAAAIVLPGRALVELGIAGRLLLPGQAVLYRVDAVGTGVL
ncbi:alpha-galactosidase [Homoserinimonas aerilata]|uniref:alpha-galactosidase n=1 Tax=Homoserinimonas aerilata TaxID=1162970 RepID=A0A542YK42_9MICO|nr:alpha-galactosidase [Homoserinimonas aerilata]TQL48440.1 alpha-galactosidase [Homoserinimonas aerilata]